MRHFAWCGFVLAVALSVATSGFAATVADSVDEWSLDGMQGENGWFYGYYNLTLDQEEGDGDYQFEDFIPFLNDGTLEVWEDNLNQWDGGGWRLYRDTAATANQETGASSLSADAGLPTN